MPRDSNRRTSSAVKPARQRRTSAKVGPRLSHVASDGTSRMVDVSGKAITVREAEATALLRFRADVLDCLMAGALPKGDAISVARVAGIQAAKRTAEWIPMCHPLTLDWVQVQFSRRGSNQLEVQCTARTTAKTGVEMEALTGATAAALTLYDMAKSADKGIVIGPIQLERKSGGKSGTYVRKR